MPDPKQKLVKVDKDVIAFPSTMEDKDISAAIKKHRSKFPVATEASEHARQLHPSNPLSTAIPHLPKWTQTPLLPYAEKAVNVVNDAANPLNWTAEGRKVKAKQDADQAHNLAAFDKEHPTQAGIAEGIKDFGESMSTPVNMGLMVAMPESKVLSAFFALQSATGAYKDTQDARQAYHEGRNKDAARLATQAVLGAGVAGMAGTHAVKGTPLGDAIAADAKTLSAGGRPSEGGFVANPIAPKSPTPTTAYKSVDQSQPFYLKSENLVGEKMRGPMPATDLHKMLLSNGVKPEEMKWTGLDELLASKGKEKVTPQEIQEHLAGNNLQVKEVQKGKPQENLPEGMTGADLDTKIRELSHWPDDVKKAKTPEQQPELDRLLRIWDGANDFNPTKFGSYVLPGGENYRELLVTMPGNGTVKIPKIKNYTMYDEHGTAIAQGSGEPSQRTLDNLAAHPNWRIERGEQNDPNAVRRDTQNFRSNHWDEPNVLGHVRFNDRTGPNGEKILHIEEAQSDWGQRIRREGGVRQEGELKLPETWKVWQPEAQKGFEQYGRPWQVLDDHGMIRGQGRSREAAEETALNTIDQMNRNLPPNMPFPKTWPELLLKRMVKYAVDHGYQGISWTPGEEQAERYDLSKQVDKIVVIPTEEGSRAVRIHTPTAGESIKLMVDKDGKVTPAFSSGNEFAGKHIADVVGKEVAEKIMSAPKETALTGVDLKVGGAGMKGFYDKIVPDIANKLGKQFGSKVGETRIKTNNPTSGDGWRQQGMWETIADDSRLGTMPLYATFDEGGNWIGTTGDPSSVDDSGGREVAIKVADEKGNLLRDTKLPSTGKSVPYLPITPKMREVVKAVPYSLFTILGAALGLSSTRANAQDKKKPTLKDLLDEAKKRDPRKKINTLPEQPKDALNHYANPEDQPPKVSFSFNKSWSKPGPYATKLTPQEEVEFRKWAASNPNSVRGEVGPAPNYDSLPMADYDVRGHFHAAKTGDPAATLVPIKWDGKIHGNDKFKTPYNGGFSNESMYATPKAPRWVGNKLMTHDGKLVTDETPRKTSGQK